MRKVTFGVANSLDNYIARADDAVDWLRWSDDVTSFIEEFWKKIDAVLMGRKTYEAAVRSGMDVYHGATNYVFSRTLKDTPIDKVTIVSQDAAAFVRELKAQDGKGICLLGGGDLANSLFEAQLIDEVSVNIHPILLGSGVPLFHELTRQVDLELIECKAMKMDCVALTYRVVKSPEG